MIDHLKRRWRPYVALGFFFLLPIALVMASNDMLRLAAFIMGWTGSVIAYDMMKKDRQIHSGGLYGSHVEVSFHEGRALVPLEDYEAARRYAESTYGVEQYMRRQRDAYRQALYDAGVKPPRVDP